MATRPIRITGSNPSTGSLTLSDHCHTIAIPGDTILWQIDQNSGVDSIISIQEKAGSTNIFSVPPHRQGNTWTGDISNSVPPCTIYVYSITWEKDGQPHTFDPIISINTALEVSLLAKIIALATVMLCGVSIMFWGKKKKKKK